MSNTANTVNTANKGMFHPDNFDTFVRVNYEEVGNKSNNGVALLEDIPSVGDANSISVYKDSIVDYLNDYEAYRVQLLFKERDNVMTEKGVIFNVDGLISSKYERPFRLELNKDGEEKTFSINAEIVFVQKRADHESTAISGEKLNYLENLPVNKDDAITGEITLKRPSEEKDSMRMLYRVEGINNFPKLAEKIEHIVNTMNTDRESFSKKSSFDVANIATLEDGKSYVEITGHVAYNEELENPYATTFDATFKVII